MWRHLGGERHDEDDSNGQSGGGGLWSRFKQVAAEVVDDLAQPQWSDDENDEDAQWEDLAEEEALYEGEEHVEDGVENAWIGDEEVDFVDEEGQPEGYLGEEDSYPLPEEANEQQQPLFRQPLVQEETAEAADDWDLEDEDLGMPNEEVFEDQPIDDNRGYTEHHANYVEEEVAGGDRAEEDDFGANAWGQDDSLNLDDSHDVGVRGSPSLVQEVMAGHSPGTYDTPAQQNDVSGWSDDLGIPSYQDEVNQGENAVGEAIEGQKSHESYYSAQNQSQLTQTNDDDDDAHEIETTAWNEDLDLSSQELDQLQHQKTETPALNDTSGINADQGNDTGVAWQSDDLKLSEHQEVTEAAYPIQNETNPIDLDASANAEVGNAWDNDDLNLSESQEDTEATQPLKNKKNALDLVAKTEACDAWDDDDLNLSEHQEEKESAQPIENEANASDLDTSANVEAGDGWDENDLILSENQEIDASQSHHESEAADLDASANAEAGNAWDNDELNLSDHQKTEADQPIQIEANSSDLYTNANVEAGDAWDGNDVNLSEHQEEATQLLQNEFNETDLDASANSEAGDVWDDDDLNLSEHQVVTEGGPPEQTELHSCAITADVWDDNLNFSDHKEEVQITQPVGNSLDASAKRDAWGDDDLDLSEYQEKTQTVLPIQAETNPTELDASANPDAGNEWDDDDLNLSDHQEAAQISEPVGADPNASENVYAGNSWDDDDVNLNEHQEVALTTQSVGVDLNASANIATGEAWDTDDVDLSGHQEEEHSAHQLQRETDATDLPAIGNSKTDTGIACDSSYDPNLIDLQGEAQSTRYIQTEAHRTNLNASATADINDTWNNNELDLDNCEETQTTSPMQAKTNPTELDASANADAGNEWDDDDDLNLSDLHTQTTSLLQTQTKSGDPDTSPKSGVACKGDELHLSDHQEAAQTTVPVGADLNPGENVDTGPTWDDDDLDLSEHQEESQTSKVVLTESIAPNNDASNVIGNREAHQTQASENQAAVQEHDVNTEAETDHARGNHVFKSTESNAGQQTTPTVTADGAQVHDVVSLGQRHDITQPLQQKESGLETFSATDRLDAGAAWYADLNLSAPCPSQVEEPGLSSGASGVDVNQVGWDNSANLDTDNLNEQEELSSVISSLPPSDFHGSVDLRDARGRDLNVEQAREASAEERFDRHAGFTPPTASVNAGDNAFGGSELDFDGSELLRSAPQMRVQHEDDDSTVEQSNTAGGEVSVEGNEMGLIEELPRPSVDQSSAELHFGIPGRTPARRATLRISNTSSAVSRMESVEEKGVQSQKIVGTSVMFAEMSSSDESAEKGPGKRDDLKEPSPGSGVSGVSMTSNELPAHGDTKEEKGNEGRRLIRDNVSSVSDDSTDGSMPLLQTQISMMTLKSVADSCPSTRQRNNDSDEDDEDDFGPVVDKTPEISSVQEQPPALSTMTINSTAVAAHSVNEDIQQDEDMDGTYYGGSTTDGGPSAENAWYEDDGSSLEGLGDLEEKMADFELPETEDHRQSPRNEAAPSETRNGEEAVNSSPRLNCSMANVYSDDNSVPSRDKDDDDEDVYKPVVDQVPKPVKLESARALNSMAVVAGTSETGTKPDEDTVGTMTAGTPTDRKADADEIDGWGDNESLDGLSEEGVADEKGIATAVATQEAEHVVVDNTPAEERSEAGLLHKGDGSLAAVESTDNSNPSRVHDSDEEQYGLVVDQIPDSPPPLIDQVSVAASTMAVATHNVDEDLKQDDDMDASDHGGSTLDDIDESGWEVDLPNLEDVEVEVGDSDGSNIPEKSQLEAPSSGNLLAEGEEGTRTIDTKRVVDLTPKMQSKMTTSFSSNSLAVMAHSVNQDFEEDDDNQEEDGANFGPIVDVTPNPRTHQPATPSSTAVVAAQLKEDFKQDETTDVGIGEVNWDDEFPELGDLQSTEEHQGEETNSQRCDDQVSQPTTFDQQKNHSEVALVDHTPEGESLRKKQRADASLAVLAPSEDGTCPSINDEEESVNDIDPHGEHVSYGPVVDMTPTVSMQRAAAPSTAPSVTFSLAVEACSVDDDIKQDEEMDETLGGDTTTCGGGVETGWDEDTHALDDLETDRSLSRHSEPSGNRLLPSGSQFESPENRILVDHTPQHGTTRPRMADASIATLAPSQASTYHSVDGENDNDTITNDEDVYGRVVDHTPHLPPIPLVTSNSMAVGASSTDFRSEMERDEDMDNTYFGDSTDDMDGWEDDDQTLEDIDKNKEVSSAEVADENLVDHTPAPVTQPKPKDPSVAVLAPSVESSSVVDGDNDSQDEKHVFGPVVDVTPEQPSDIAAITGSLAVEAHSLAEDIRRDEEMDGTMFGDSTSAGGGWDEDETALDDLAAEDSEATPAIGGQASSNVWQSTEILSENTSSRMEGSTSAERASENGVVLVDHTPSEIDSTVPKNTVGWLLNVESGISGDNDADDMDGDWAQDGPVLEDGAPPRQGTEEDQVVDRVPQRPESRFGDASTLVVADPSEVLSHVDDMLQEEGNFGPVVDQTPPSHPVVLHALSGAGSTAVVAPTVVHDELDDGDDSANDEDANEDGNGGGWDPNPSGLEQAPNPQSGNDEDTAPRVREQVVDFLPPQEFVGEQNRAGWSEVTTGGVPSVLQVDPKEDEFGPVVDQLPLPQPSTPFSAISTASQVASSECEALAVEDETEEAESKQEKNSSNVVVDPLPRPFEIGSAMQNLDSTASLIQSSTSDDDDDDDDDDDVTGKYGPVVDHLPSVRSSLPPSRGGSTVDALATVSEVNDDDGDSSDDGGNDGWDDDLGEIDLAEDEQKDAYPASKIERASKATELQTGEEKSQTEKSMTVRFRSVVAAIFEPGSGGDTGDDAENNVEGSDTDAANAWDDDLDFDLASVAGADGQTAVASSDRHDYQFSEADTPPATPYSHQKAPNYMEADQDLPDGVTLPEIGSSFAVESDLCACANATTIDCPCVQRILKNGINDYDSVRIDYQMLLQTEISKRRLVEEESKDLRAQLEALQKSKSAGEVNMETVQTLQDYVQRVEANLNEVRKECESLRIQNKELQTSYGEAQLDEAEKTKREEQWRYSELELRKEYEQKEESLAEKERQLKAKEKELLAEVEEREETVQKLSKQIGSLQSEYSSLRETNDTLTTDLKALRETLTQRDEELERSRSREVARDKEMNNLKITIERMQHENNSIATLEGKIDELQGQLTSKDSECEDLKTKIVCLQEQLDASERRQRSVGQQDEARSTQHEEEKVHLQEQLASLKAQIDETQSLREEESVSKWKLHELESEAKRLSEEKDILTKKLREMQINDEDARSEFATTLNQKDRELQAASAEVSELKKQNENLSAEMTKQKTDLGNAELLESQLHSVSDERDSLRKALNESNETIQKLKLRVEEHGAEESVIEEKRNKEIESLGAQLTSLRKVIAANKKQIEALQKKIERITSEKLILEDEVSDWRSKCSNLEEAMESSTLDAARDESSRGQLIRELESLRDEVASAATERGQAKKSQDDLLHKCKEMESSLNDAMQDSETNVRKAEEMQTSLSKAEAELARLRQELEAASNERDQYREKCSSIEQSLATASQSSQEASRLSAVNASMSNEVQRLQQELDEQNSLLQDYEAKIAALSEDLSSERQSSYKKEQDLTELQRQLEVTLAHLEESSADQSELPDRIAELETLVSNLEAERSDYEKRLALSSSKEKEFHEISESLSQDMETARRERDALREENEEMLVQFGYLNEQVDAYDHQIQELKSLAEEYNHKVETGGAQLRELQERLAAAESTGQENGEHHASLEAQAQTELTTLRQEHDKLMEELNELTTGSAEKDLRIKSLTLELEALQSQLEELNLATSDSEAVTAENDRLQSQVEELKLLRNELNERCRVQNEEVTRLSNMLDASQNTSSSLQSRIQTLEKACSEKDHFLQQKDTEMRDLMNRLHEARGESKESQEMVMLRERLNQMENRAIEMSDRANEMEHNYRTSKEELQSTSEELSTMENTVADLQKQIRAHEEAARDAADTGSLISELENKLQNNSKTISELSQENSGLSTDLSDLKSQLKAVQEEKRIKSLDAVRLFDENKSLREQVEGIEQREASSQELIELEKTLQSKSKTIAELAQENAALSTELSNLKSQFKKEQEQAHVNSIENDKRITDEVESLKEQLNELNLKFESSTQQRKTQEESLNADLKRLQHKLASKDGEVMMMKRKLETANRELQVSRGETQASKEMIDRMSSEIESLREQQSHVLHGRSSTAAKLLQQSKENAEDVDNLRSSVISLAAALETSESRRADAIDRLLKERQTHAESLRRLADSVKRFYATVNCSEK